MGSRSGIRDFANVLAALTDSVAPLACEAWRDYLVDGARFGHAELDLLTRLLTAVPDEHGYTLRPHPGAPAFTRDLLRDSLGSEREVNEFLAKLAPRPRTTFPLPLESLSADQMEARLQLLETSTAAPSE